jgi:hypothetical protein
MTNTKLEELFNLEPTNINTEENIKEEYPTYDVEDIQSALNIAEKIDKALPQVKGMDSDDKDFDEYARKAMDTYDRLVDLGMNVDDRNAGTIFAVASTMMTNAIAAKTAKLDKKLKMIDLQLKKANLDLKVQLEQDKKNAASSAAKVGDGNVIEADGIIVSDRNSLLKEIMAQVKENK